MRLHRRAAVIALALILAGCSTVVDGTGRTARFGGPPSAAPSGPPSPGPSSAGPSSAAPAKPTGCPHVIYPAAKLSFDCITSGLTAFYDGNVWPVSEQKTVEPATQWVLEEGAGHWGSPEGQTLVDIAQNVRQQMIGNGGYGENPRVRTVASRPMQIDGAPGYLLQTTITINPGWAQRVGTKVKHEKLWIVAVEVGAGDVSLWYTSLPDLAKALWPKVSATIGSIKVG